MVSLQIGMDAGGSLTKVVTIEGNRRDFCMMDLDSAVEMAKSLSECEGVYLTGCRADILESHLPEAVRKKVHRADELTAFWTGARHLLADEGKSVDAFVLVGFGTGTSVFAVEEGNGVRAAGTAVGGGTITGLSSLLLRTDSFEGIMEKAQRGNRHRVDLMVSDLYPDAKASPVLNELTASNFGAKTASLASEEDIASAILQLVIETIAVIAIQVARTHRLDTVVVAGSPTRHPLVRSRFHELGTLLGHDFFIFLEHGPYCGALGAVMLSHSCRS